MTHRNTVNECGGRNAYECRQRTCEMCMYDLMEMNVRGWGDLVEAGT